MGEVGESENFTSLAPILMFYLPRAFDICPGSAWMQNPACHTLVFVG